MRGRKKKEKPEESVQTEILQQPGFKIKLTNIRTSSYPKELTETDIFKFKTGDYLVKSTSSKTIYQIVNLSRESFFAWECDIEKDVDKDLLEKVKEYRKTGNFGVCYMHIKCIMRNGKRLKKAQLIRVSEIRNSINPTYRRFVPFDVYQAIAYKTSKSISLHQKITTLLSKRSFMDAEIKELHLLRDEMENKSTEQAKNLTNTVIETPLI